MRDRLFDGQESRKEQSAMSNEQWTMSNEQQAKKMNNKRQFCSLFIVHFFVGPQGLEPWTNRLWVYCSNHLSYGPLWNFKMQIANAKCNLRAAKIDNYSHFCKPFLNAFSHGIKPGKAWHVSRATHHAQFNQEHHFLILAVWSATSTWSWLKRPSSISG